MRSEVLILALLLAWQTQAEAGKIVRLEPVGPTWAVIETDLAEALRRLDPAVH